MSLRAADSVRAELTGTGAALAPRLAPALGMVTSRLFDGFSSADLQALTLMLRRMLDNLAAQPGRDRQPP